MQTNLSAFANPNTPMSGASLAGGANFALAPQSTGLHQMQLQPQVQSGLTLGAAQVASNGATSTAENEFNKACQAAVGGFVHTYLAPAIIGGIKKRYGIDYSVDALREDIRSLHLGTSNASVSVQNATLGGMLAAAPASEKPKKTTFPKLPIDQSKKCQYQKSRGTSKGQMCQDFVAQGYNYCNKCLNTERVIRELTQQGIPTPDKALLGSTSMTNGFGLAATNATPFGTPGAIKPPATNFTGLGSFQAKPGATPGTLNTSVYKISLSLIEGYTDLYEETVHHFIVKDAGADGKIIMGIRNGTTVRKLSQPEVQIALTMKELKLHQDAIENSQPQLQPQVQQAPAQQAPVQAKPAAPQLQPQVQAQPKLPNVVQASSQQFNSLQAAINQQPATISAHVPTAAVSAQVSMVNGNSDADRLAGAPAYDAGGDQEETVGQDAPQLEPQLSIAPQAQVQMQAQARPAQPFTLNMQNALPQPTGAPQLSGATFANMMKGMQPTLAGTNGVHQ